MNIERESVNSYDAVPYKSFPFAQTYPSRLATIATLFGMRPQPIDNCRVLELACSSGGNLIPMAEQSPGSRFIGVDASRVAIADGQKTIERLGMKNIELQHRDISELGPELGTFDYIIAHGVFSWVPTEIQEKILEVCARNVAPDGVAYVSYNTYPGWHMRGMIRDVMFYRARFFEKPDERLREARSLVNFLAKSTPTDGNPYGILLNEELKQLQRKEDYYLTHEFLEENNAPLYFYQFMERAGAKGLQYLGEAEFSMMSVNNFPPEIAAMLRRLSSDMVQMEQYMDFVRNRMFRQTLLCRRDRSLGSEPSVQTVLQMVLASNAEPETPIQNLFLHDRVTFRRPGSMLTTTEPLVKAAMLELRQAWPRRVHFPELLASARGRLRPGPAIIDATREKAEALVLAEPMLRCFATTHVDLSVWPSQPSLDLADRPHVSPLARLQAESSNIVTNLRHETAQLSDLCRFLVPRLDGTHNREDLTDVLLAEVRQGRLVVHDKGHRVEDDEHARKVVGRLLDETLHEIAVRGLLRRGA